MTGFLLDTNILSELRKQHFDNRVRAWFDEHDGDDFWLSVLVVGELRKGIALLERRDATAAARLGEWLDSIVDEFADRILPVSLPISVRWAGLNVPDPLPVIDGLMAATALEHELILVTRNVGDMQSTGVSFVNPFD